MPTNKNAHAAWNALVEVAQNPNRKPITYRDLGRKIGMHHRVLRWPLHAIQDHCLEQGLPPLTTLVVRELDFQPGERSYAVPNSQAAVQRVFTHEWRNEKNPF